MPYLDLSHPMHPGMTVFPGDAPLQFTPSCTMPPHNCRSTLVSFTTHTGTHVDAPSHTGMAGKTLSQLPLDAFFGGAAVVDCTGLPPGASIPLALLRACPSAVKAQIVLLRTGWDAHYCTDAYFSGFPCLDEEAALWLADTSKTAVAVDALSVDPTDSHDMPIHQILLEGGVLIYENLCNLDGLPAATFDFYGLPIHLRNLDAAPVRAMARW